MLILTFIKTKKKFKNFHIFSYICMKPNIITFNLRITLFYFQMYMIL